MGQESVWWCGVVSCDGVSERTGEVEKLMAEAWHRSAFVRCLSFLPTYLHFTPALLLLHSSFSLSIPPIDLYLLPFYIPTTQPMSSPTQPSSEPHPEPPRPKHNLRNPLPLSASQEGEVKQIYYKRVRGHCAAEIKGTHSFRCCCAVADSPCSVRRMRRQPHHHSYLDLSAAAAGDELVYGCACVAGRGGPRT